MDRRDHQGEAGNGANHGRNGQFRQFIAYAPVAIAMLDRDLRYLAASQRWIEDYGLAGRALEGRSHYEIFPEIPPAWREIHRRALAGEICRAEEDRFERADGQVQWLWWDVRPWFDEAGEIGGILILTEDITRRKIAEEEIRFERDKLAAVIAALDVGIVILEPDETIALQNAAAQRIIGTAAAAPGDWRAVNARFDMRDQDGRSLPIGERPLAQAAKGETVHDFDVTVRETATGATRFLRLGAAPIRNAAGEVALRVLSVSDLTGMHRTEVMLRASEDRYRAIFEAAPNTMVVMDQDGIIQAANPAASATFGYTPAELIGRNVSLLMPESEAGAHGGFLRRYRATGERRIVGIGRAVRARRRDGELFPVELTVTEWTNEAGDRLFCGTLTDLTARQQAEEAVAEAQRLEAVALLAGGVAHDFNNALAVILGNLEPAAPRIADSTARDPVERALRAARLASTVSRRLLALARSPQEEARVASLNDIVRDASPLLESLLAGRWSVRLELAEELWSALVQPGEITSAVLNLAANARDAMPDGGEVEIATRNLPAEGVPADLPPGDYVCLSVADTGAGMSGEVLARAWEPFFSTKREGRGTGLGLTTVRKLVEQARGFARIASAPGRGTTVSLFLPRFSTPPSAVAAADTPSVPYGDGETILVVDDNDEVRETTMRRLEALGYAVRSARSGNEAIHELTTDPAVDLVFTDAVMPGLTGYQLAQWVRQHLPHVAVALTSGFPGRAGQPGSDDGPALLHKPYTREQLARFIFRALADAAGRPRDDQPQNT